MDEAKITADHIGFNTGKLKLPDPTKVPMLSFSDEEGNVIGELWNREGKLYFEGDCDKSAEVFFNAVIKQYVSSQ